MSPSKPTILTRTYYRGASESKKVELTTLMGEQKSVKANLMKWFAGKKAGLG